MAENFSSTDYYGFREEFGAALAWLSSLGIRCEVGRLGDYRRSIDELVRIYESGDAASAESFFGKIVTALFEAHEIVFMHRGLKNVELNDHMLTKLREMASGPSSYLDENSSSTNRSRNLMFELIIISRLAHSGISSICTSDSDVFFEFNNRAIYLECKRPRSKQSILRNSERANSQLNRRYRDVKNVRSRGIIGIDLSLVVNPEFQLLNSESPSGAGEFLSGKIIDLIDFVKPQINPHKKTIAFLVRASLMSVDRSRNGRFTYCQQYNVFPFRGHGTGLELAKELSSILDRDNMLSKTGSGSEVSPRIHAGTPS